MKKTRQHKINTDIKSTNVRLVGNGEPQVLSYYEAIKLAQSEGMDLICISDNGDTPVVRIEEYNKFLYNLEKKQKETKRNAVKIETHELKFSCEIDSHDLLTKSKKAVEFLTDGDKVKCTIQLKGRQNAKPERGELKMLELAALVDKIGLPETFPKLEGNKIIMILKPLPKNK